MLLEWSNVARLQEETARVEEYLVSGTFTGAITRCFIDSKANAFENLLEPLQKLLRLSPPVAHTLAQAEFFARIHSKLSSNKALIRLNLLRIVQCICDASEEQGALISVYGLYETIQKLADLDSAILVRDMASKLVRNCDEHEIVVRSGGRRRAGLRRTSSSTTPPSLAASISMPPTPTSSRFAHSTTYMLDRERSRNSYSNLNFNSHTQVKTMSRNHDRDRGRDKSTDGSRSTTPTTTTSTSSTALSIHQPPALSRTTSRVSIASSTDFTRPESSGSTTAKSRLPRTATNTNSPSTPSTPTITSRPSRQSLLSSTRKQDFRTGYAHSHRASLSGASHHPQTPSSLATRAGNRDKLNDRDKDRSKTDADGSGTTVATPNSRRRRLQQG